MADLISCHWCNGEGEVPRTRLQRPTSPDTTRCTVCKGLGAITRSEHILNLRAEREAQGRPILSGRRPRFDRIAAQDMQGLHNAGWSLGQIAREFKASRSLVTKYVRGFQPQKWSA